MTTDGQGQEEQRTEERPEPDTGTPTDETIVEEDDTVVIH